MNQGSGREEADGEPLLAGRQTETEGDMGLAGSAVAERDDILTTLDVFASRQLQNQHLVERCEGLEVEADPLPGRACAACLIPTVIDQNPCAHLRMPRDMIFHGWSMRLFQAWQHSATMSS